MRIFSIILLLVLLSGCCHCPAQILPYEMQPAGIIDRQHQRQLQERQIEPQEEQIELQKRQEYQERKNN